MRHTDMAMALAMALKIRCPNPNCKRNIDPVQVGSTLNGTPLWACPKCGVEILQRKLTKHENP